MSRPDDIAGYAYKADIYTPETILEAMGDKFPEALVEEWGSVEKVLDIHAQHRGIDRDDERSFDSDEFPKVVFRDEWDAIDRAFRDESA